MLLAYFSRPGENYYYGGRRNLHVGNTEVLAEMIARLTGVDLHKVEAAEPYSTDYDATVARNAEEQQNRSRPAIANPLDSIDSYDTVLLASPVWNVRPPMIMATFAESYDVTNKTVYPVVTYAVSGIGDAVSDYTATCQGARVQSGLAVQGEEVGQAEAQVRRWLQDRNLITSKGIS